MIEWLIEKGIGFVFKQIISAPVKIVLKVGFLVRRSIEYRKLHITEVTRKANLYLLGISGGLLVLGAALSLIFGALVATVVTAGCIILIAVGYWNTEVDMDLKRAQEIRAQSQGGAGMTQGAFEAKHIVFVAAIFFLLLSASIYIFSKEEELEADPPRPPVADVGGLAGLKLVTERTFNVDPKKGWQNSGIKIPNDAFLELSTLRPVVMKVLTIDKLIPTTVTEIGGSTQMWVTGEEGTLAFMANRNYKSGSSPIEVKIKVKAK